jgi:hypothetical protein
MKGGIFWKAVCWICKECGKQFRAEIDLDQHQSSKRHTGKSLDLHKFCMICNKGFLTENGLIMHQNSAGHSNNPATIRNHKSSIQERDDLRNQATAHQPATELGSITNELCDVCLWDATNSSSTISKRFNRLVQSKNISQIKASKNLWRLECYVNPILNGKGPIIPNPIMKSL